MLEIDNTLQAQDRAAGTKGTARKLRRAGRLPAIVYGPTQEARYLSLDPKMFVIQRKRFGEASLYTLASAGVNTKCIIKEVQVHPVSRAPLHVDLYAVDMKRALRVEVPIELTGKAAGIVDGGLLSQLLSNAEVLCLPDHIPAKLVADVTPLKVGESLHLSDIQLPEGVKFTAHDDQAIARVAEPDAAPVTPAADAAAATPAAGAAATTAAAAKPGDKK